MARSSGIPVDEFMFLPHDVLRIDRRGDLPGFADLTPDLTRPIPARAAMAAPIRSPSIPTCAGCC